MPAGAKPGIVHYDDPSRFPAGWKTNEQGMEAVRIAQAMATSKSGLYANIPIVCKGSKCPYNETCSMVSVGIDVDALIGQRCPVEIAEIMQRFNWYIGHLGVESDNIVDLSMVKELVDIDIMLERASKRMAQEGDFIEMVAVGVSESGDPIRRPEIRKSVDFKERMQKRKNDLLTLLNSTRKDKAGSKLTIEMDPSTYAASLMEKKRQLDTLKENDGIINVTDYTTVGDE